jgi:hypothetical protein
MTRNKHSTAAVKSGKKMMKLKIQFDSETLFDQPIGCTPEPGYNSRWHPGFVTRTSLDRRSKPINPDLTMTGGCFLKDASS